VDSYRLYPGGTPYSVPTLDSDVAGVELAPDPLTNPLGLFQRELRVRLHDHTAIQGTVLIYGVGPAADLELHGDDVTLSTVPLPSLYGESTRLQLPAAIVGDDFKVVTGNADVTGKLVVGGDFTCLAGPAATACTARGGLICKELTIQRRDEWDQSDTWWRQRLDAFHDQLGNANPVPFFPLWLESQSGLKREPKLRIEPDPAGATHCWPDWSQPLFLPHPDDGGLRWELVRWTNAL
jgi:hypothetical protein